MYSNFEITSNLHALATVNEQTRLSSDEISMALDVGLNACARAKRQRITKRVMLHIVVAVIASTRGRVA